MMPKYLIGLAFFLASSCTVANGCFSDRSSSLTPLSEGPLVLSSFYCRPRIQEWSSTFVVSPDRRSAASLQQGKVSIASLGVENEIFQITGLSHIAAVARGPSPLLRWSRDSRFVWASDREVTKPSGFSLSGLRPLRIFATGETRLLPALKHPAGPLDILLWGNDKGLALAVFGIRGDYYRPEHADPEPTIAIVDAARGVVLDSFPILDLVHEVIRNKAFPNRATIGNAAIAVLPDGRVRVLLSFLQFHEWVLWTQNEKPRLLRHPYMDLQNIQLTMSPDGEKVLVFQTLRTKGEFIEESRRPGHHRSSPGEPVNGLLASLYDINTGKELWNVPARVTLSPSGMPPAPVISEDGRFALIRLPADRETASIALVSMQDGKILQRLPIADRVDSQSHSMGFDNQGVWTRTYDLTAFYSFGSQE